MSDQYRVEIPVIVDGAKVATIHLENVTDTAGLVRALDRVAQPYAGRSQEVPF